MIDDIKLNSNEIPGIQGNIDTLKSITNEFLNLFNGILNTVEENEANLSSTNKSLFNLEDDIKSCITLFKPIIQSKQVTLSYQIEPGTPKLFYANMTVIKRVLINLIGNAVKFTSNGYIIVKACYKKNKLHIEVEDTGVLNVEWQDGTLGSMSVTMLTYPKNLEGSITILGEKGTVKVGGVAVNDIQHWEFEDTKDYDKKVKDVNYKTNSIYGFGHSLYYKNVIDVLFGKTSPETSGREGLKSLEVLIASYISAKNGKTVYLPLKNGI
mgnify:CR=1 FL=1